MRLSIWFGITIVLIATSTARLGAADVPVDFGTSPLQTLYLLNSDFAVRRSSVLAQGLQQPGKTPTELIGAAFRRILIRDPDPEELSAALELWNASSGAVPLESVCQALLNLNEFQYQE